MFATILASDHIVEFPKQRRLVTFCIYATAEGVGAFASRIVALQRV